MSNGRLIAASVLACGLLAQCTLLAGCGSSAPSARPSTASHASEASRTTSTRTPRTTAAPARRRHRPHHHRSAPPPGSLPQTMQMPSSRTRAFHVEMAALWRGIQRGAVGPAMPAFFPGAAYVQLKRVGDPAGDWQDRLVGDYALDIAAAHRLLGPRTGSARLLSVVVPAGFAHWVPPGVCDNGIGYYETPNSRVVYRAGGQVRSFGIASMISWRGVWYVVHLGSVLRPAVVGEVDEPAVGVGAPVPSSTC